MSLPVSSPSRADSSTASASVSVLPEATPDLSVAPRTLRSLFGLRICLCLAAGGLALIKALLTPPLSAFFAGAVVDTNPNWAPWLEIFNLLISGLLGVTLALILTTLLTQARLQAYLSQEHRELPGV